MFPLFPKKPKPKAQAPRIHNPATYDYGMSPDGAMTPAEQKRRALAEAEEHNKRVTGELARQLSAIGRGL